MEPLNCCFLSFSLIPTLFDIHLVQKITNAINNRVIDDRLKDLNKSGDLMIL